MAVPRFVSQAVGKTLATVGRTGDYLTPGSGTNRLTTLGRNIDNPEVDAYGTPRTTTQVLGANNTANVDGAMYYDSTTGKIMEYRNGTWQEAAPASDGVPTSGIYDAAGASGAASYDPDTDPSRVASVRGEIGGLYGAFDSAVNDVFTQIDQLAAEKKAQFVDNYKGQKDKLSRNLVDTSRTIDDQFSARNAYHGSYREREQDVAEGAFKDAIGGLEKAEQGDLASVGKFAEEQKASISAGRPSFDVNQYSSVSDLLSIKQDVDSAIREMSKTQAGLRTDSQYAQNLNKIAPTQEQGSSALKSQLDRLAGTNTNSETKRVIASTAIADAGEDEAQWMDYFERVLGQQGSQASLVA